MIVHTNLGKLTTAYIWKFLSSYFTLSWYEKTFNKFKNRPVSTMTDHKDEDTVELIMNVRNNLLSYIFKENI